MNAVSTAPLPIPPLRLGFVPYFNVQPMRYGLREQFPQFEQTQAVPHRLDQMLREGQIDLGTLPIFSAFAEGRAVYPAPVIASCGAVYSVLIVSQRPIHDLRHIYRDPHSLTSNALAAVLLRNFWRAEAEFSGEADAEAIGEDEGRVLIGDPAIRQRSQWRHIYDLGEAWRQWTDLPFVFAAWIGPAGQSTGGFRQAMEQTVAQNFARLEEVAASYALLAGVPLPERVAYLRHYLSFHFGPKERQAIERFHGECAKLELVKTKVVRFEN